MSDRMTLEDFLEKTNADAQDLSRLLDIVSFVESDSTQALFHQVLTTEFLSGSSDKEHMDSLYAVAVSTMYLYYIRKRQEATEVAMINDFFKKVVE